MPMLRKSTPRAHRNANLRALVAALLLLALVLGLVSSCGSEDLIFPGEIPNTPTPGPNTATPTSAI